MDNACSRAVQKYIKSTKADIQLVNPDDHRVNACERAIQTWKNHWIAGLSTLDPTCPLQLWCQFIEQGQDTLNMLRKARVNPKLSAYAILEGQFDFNKTPLAPVGTKSLVFLDPKHRRSFQTKAMDAYYCGPVKMHYRNYRFYIPETRNYRTSNSAKFFPAHCKMPAIEPGDTIRLAAQDLITALRNKHSKAPINLDHSHTSALRQLTEIFHTLETVNEEKDTPPRVPGQPTRVQPSTSHDATAPRVVAQQPRVHQRTTRANKPMPAIAEEEDELETPPTLKEKSKATKRFERRTSARQAAKEQRQADNEAIETAIEEIKTVEAPPPITNRPRRSIAQYQREKATKTFDVLQPVPITQDEEDEISFANALFACLPKLHTTKSPCNISSAAIYHVMGTSLESPTAGAFVPARFGASNAYNVPLEACANAVVHPITKETITKYDKLANDPVTRDVWTAAFCKELGRLAQGWDSTEGTNTIFFMTKEEIAKIPKDRTVTYARIVVDYRPQKADPN
jgi:hypothetical protein